MNALFRAAEAKDRDAAALGIEITAAQAAAHITDIDVKKLITPLYSGFAHTPIALLDDSVSYSNTKWTRGHEWFAVSFYPGLTEHELMPQAQLWRATGNARHLNSHHPLTRVENVLWALIFRIAHHELTAEAAYTAFFTDETVKDVLSQPPNPAYKDELCGYSSSQVLHFNDPCCRLRG